MMQPERILWQLRKYTRVDLITLPVLARFIQVEKLQ